MNSIGAFEKAKRYIEAQEAHTGDAGNVFQ